jgi:hypothetical protein
MSFASIFQYMDTRHRTDRNSDICDGVPGIPCRRLCMYTSSDWTGQLCVYSAHCSISFAFQLHTGPAPHNCRGDNSFMHQKKKPPESGFSFHSQQHNANESYAGLAGSFPSSLSLSTSGCSTAAISSGVAVPAFTLSINA